MSDHFYEQDGQEYLTKGQVLAYAGYKSDHWLYARIHDGRLTQIPIDGKTYYARKELDELLTPQVPEQQHSRHREEEEYVRIKDVAERMHFSKSYISRLVRDGEIKAINLSGKQGRGADYRIHKNEFARFMREREKAGVTSR